jgi:hypothetical protein
MKYAHPNVLDNGPAFIRANAVRVLLVSRFNTGMKYADILSASLLSAAVAANDFTFSDEDTGRKMVFGGAVAVAGASAPPLPSAHVVFVDADGAVLWADGQAQLQAVLAGQAYALPKLTYIVPQLQ